MTEYDPMPAHEIGSIVTPVGDEASDVFVPNSAIGQHILLDQAVLQMAADLVPVGSNVIEIGAGPGTLTKGLLARNAQVVAYEIDQRCEPMLTELAAQTGRLAVRWENFLEATTEEIEERKPFHIVGNIPFQISEPLITKMTAISFASAVLLVGENLVKSMTTKNPDSGSFSRLSLITGGYFDVEKLAQVPRDSFDPPPRVNAGLIRLTRKDAEPSWRSDAVARSYRALVEAQGTNSTVAKALKTVVVTPKGKAESGAAKKRSVNRRAERRVAKSKLNEMARDYNSGDFSRHTSSVSTSLDMFTIISRTVDEGLLSRPLSGLSNGELVKICSAITTSINRRTKTR